MKRLLAAFMLLSATPAFAEGGMKYIPRWHMNPEGTEACYGLEEAKLLLLADKQLTLCETTRSTVSRLTLSIAELEAALRKKDIRIADDDLLVSKLQTRLEDEIRAKELYKAQANSGPSVGWLVAGGVTLVLAGVIVGRVW